MPILEECDDASVGLSQGDILEKVSLFSTAWSMTDGGSARPSRDDLCLVLSRPCNAIRDELVVVAAIAKYQNKPGMFKSFDECWEFYKDVRDGASSPDQFYLGEIPGRDGPFCARFDRIYTVGVPAEGAARDEFIKRKRIGRLNRDFLQDLHVRLNRAFASLGFDDHDWFPTKDLQALLSFARVEEGKLQALVDDAQSQVHLGEAGFIEANQLAAQAKKLTQARQALDDFRAMVQPFSDCLTARGSG